MDVVSVIVAGLDNLGIGFIDSGLLGEFALEHTESAFKRTVEKPADKTEGEYVAALEDALVVQSRLGQRGFGHRSDGHFHHLGLDVEFLERIESLEKRLFEI